MNIRKLKIEHFGSISCFEAVFHSDLIVISGRNSEIIASAVKLLTGGRLSKQEEFLLLLLLVYLQMDWKSLIKPTKMEQFIGLLLQILYTSQKNC